MFTDSQIKWTENFAVVAFNIFFAGLDDSDATLSS